MNGRTSRLLTSLLISASWAGLAHAQSADLSPPPVREFVDSNGVDLFAGTLTLAIPGVSIGDPSAGGLSFSRVLRGDGIYDSFDGFVYVSGATYTVTLNGTTEKFTKSGSTYTPVEQRGSTFDGTTYTDAAGNIAKFRADTSRTGTMLGRYIVSTITRPDGTVATYNYKTVTYTADVCANGTAADSTQSVQPSAAGAQPNSIVDPPCTNPTYVVTRLQSITTNTGYMLYMSYAGNDPNDDADAYVRLIKVAAVNRASTYSCDPTAISCSLPNAPTTAFGTGTVTDANLGVTKYTYNNYGVINLTRPGSAAANITVTHNTATTGTVSSVTKDGIDTSYTYSDSGNTRTVTVKRSGSGNGRIVTFDIPTLRIMSDTDELGHRATYAYYPSGDPAEGLLKSLKQPEGNMTVYHYDARGNVTSTDTVSKDGGTTYTARASYPSSCANPVTCNEPTTTTDIRGNVTDYSYDPTHGRITSVTPPAVGSVAPQTRYVYAQKQAYIKDTDGTVIAAGPKIWKLTGTSACQTGAPAALTSGAHATCEGHADEVKTTITYGLASGVNNLLVTSIATGAGDGSLTATTATSYDGVGNVQSVDGPLSGTADTIWYRYDALRRQTGVIGPDPDTSGSVKAGASETTYNADGTVSAIEVGSVTTPGPTGWNGFTGINRQEFSYTNGRKVRSRLIDESGSNPPTKSATQWSYDARGRLDCTAIRMTQTNYDTDSEYAALASTSACTVKTAGDRITRTTYDLDDRPLKGQVLDGSAFTTTAQTSYTVNGQTAWVADGNGNKTSYAYDGFDRLVQTRFPKFRSGQTADSPGNSADAACDTGDDCETRVYTVNASENMTLVVGRDRDYNKRIEYWYNDLGQLGKKARTQTGESNPLYYYDNLGRVTLITDDSGSSANDLSYKYDALGHELSETSPTGALKSAWNLDGTRNRLTWPDGFYVTYDYYATGAMKDIKQSGTTTLATFYYDDLGRRTQLKRGNGTTTGYHYNVWGMDGLTLGFPADADSNESVTFYRNAAGQIYQRIATNDTYSWDQAGNTGNVTRPYTVNALDQYTLIGNAPTAYIFSYTDTHGNLTKEHFPGATGYPAADLGTFTYTSENMLKSSRVQGDPRSGDTSATTAALTYDNLNRLQQTVSGPAGGTQTTDRYGYDGDEMVARYDAGGAIERHYVRGPWADEPIVAVRDTGQLDYYHADERGSIVALSNSSGVRTAVNTYDEFGIPSSTSTGLFGYTGQMYLADLGMSFYKARVYSPTLGRFLQTDPIGYGDGANWYNYAHGDPVNGTDPSGLQQACSPTPSGAPGGPAPNPNGQYCYNVPEPVTGPPIIVNAPSGDFIGGGTLSGPSTAQATSMPGTSGSYLGEAMPQMQQAQMCPAAYTRNGDTKGDNPQDQGDRYNTDLPGGYEAALATFEGLTRLDAIQNGGDGGSHLEFDPRRPTTVYRSNSGNIGLRYAFSNGNLVFRVDINPNTFSLTKAETIHFNGNGRGNMCPTR